MSDPIRSTICALRAIDEIARRTRHFTSCFGRRPTVILLGRSDYGAVRMIPAPFSISATVERAGMPPVEEIYGLRIIRVDDDVFFEVAYL